MIVLVIVSIGVIWVRSGTTGRYLDAMRGSEVAAAAIQRHRLPPIVTEVAPVKLVPAMVTAVPPKVGPLLGVIDVTVGGGGT